jgi:hypothetical protein
LCVTERREAFMPWLLWGFDRQTLPCKELVIVDSSERPYASDRADVRVISAPPGSNVPEKRNLALQAARGDFIAWFDDDDWQHPQRLERLAPVLAGGRSFAGGSRSWFIDVVGLGCRRYNGHGALIFNTALFRRDVACSVSFDPRHRRASDTVWMREIMLRHGGRGQLVDECLMLWLCHDDNISNPRTRRGFPSQLEDVRADIGPNAWADTRERLEALRARLPARAQPPLPPAPGFRREPWSLRGPRTSGRPAPTELAVPATATRAEAPATQPPAAAMPHVATKVALLDYPATPATTATVTFLLVAEASDAAHVERVAPHIRQQARFAFHEAHALASTLGGSALRGPLERLQPTKAIDSIYEARTLSPNGEVALTSWMDALEAAKGDYVVFARPTILFHASGLSWVAEALARLERDARLVSMTTQAGPSVGPAGSARSAPNVASPVWDPELRIWRHAGAPCLYGVAARARLLELLRGGIRARPTAKLEPWAPAMRRVLCESGAVHGTLAMKGSWALEARGTGLASHAEVLVSAIEHGAFPSHQPGNGVIALDVPAVLAAWHRTAASLPASSAERAA